MDSPTLLYYVYHKEDGDEDGKTASVQVLKCPENYSNNWVQQR